MEGSVWKMVALVNSHQFRARPSKKTDTKAMVLGELRSCPAILRALLVAASQRGTSRRSWRLAEKRSGLGGLTPVGRAEVLPVVAGAAFEGTEAATLASNNWTIVISDDTWNDMCSKAVGVGGTGGGGGGG